MRKNVGVPYIATIGIVFLGVVGAMLYFTFSKQSNQTKIPQIDYKITQQISPSSPPSPFPITKVLEYPPLYPQVQWGQPTHVQMGVVIQSSSGIKKISVEATQIQSVLLHQHPLDNNNKFYNEFWHYYYNTLKARGWAQYQLNDSSGPQGATLFWVNSDHYFGISWSEEYNGAPQTDMYGKQLNLAGYRLFIEYN